LWTHIAASLAIVINLLVASFYPFKNDDYKGWQDRIRLLIYPSMLLSLAAIINPIAIKTLVFCVMVEVIFWLGVQNALVMLGGLGLLNRFIFLLSYIGNKGMRDKSPFEIVMESQFLIHVLNILFCILGLFVDELFYSVLLFDFIIREETLLNVIRSVTRNVRSLMLTALLAIVLVYMFSIVGYLFLQQDFQVSVMPRCIATSQSKVTSQSLQYCHNDKDCNETQETAKIMEEVGGCAEGMEEVEENHCETLLMCIITTLNEGLRNGGGIGDILRKPSHTEGPRFFLRFVYDLLFFFILIIIVLNLIFGVIIDTFADLRSEKQCKDDVLKNTCFICGLERKCFDNKTVSFDKHIKDEHNMWHYLYFIVLLKTKDETEFTGPESYVKDQIQDGSLQWFPRLQAMSLSDCDVTEDHEELAIKPMLSALHNNITNLTQQLQILQDQVAEQKRKQQRLTIVNPNKINNG